MVGVTQNNLLHWGELLSLDFWGNNLYAVGEGLAQRLEVFG